MYLPSLPEDLLLCIASHLHLNDCKQVRLTCKTLAYVFASVVLKSIIIDIMEVDESATHMDQLKLLACGHPKVPIHAIKVLNIWSLSPANNQKYLDDTGIPIFEAEEKDAIEERITEALKPALQALEEVHTLRWFARIHDPEDAHEVVADIVSKYPHLIRLDINVSEFKLSLFDSFRNLSSIKYFCSRDVPDHIVEGIAQAIAQSPRLRSLELEMQAEDGSFDLHRFFAAYPLSERQPLSLTHLSIYNCRAYINHEITLPHIGTLTSLHLLTERSLWERADASYETKVYLNGFWTTLRQAKVQLEHIVVDKFTMGLVNYLRSYAGLKSLKFSDNRRMPLDGVGADNPIASVFFEESLERHLITLEELDIRPTYNDYWCFRKDYKSTFSRFSNLSSLCIGISRDQLTVADTSTGSTPAVNELYLLLDTILAHSKCIKKITLKPVAPDPADQQLVGQTLSAFFRDFVDAFNASISEYVAPVACQCLPELYTTGPANTFNRRRFYTATRSLTDDRVRFETCQET